MESYRFWGSIRQARQERHSKSNPPAAGTKRNVWLGIYGRVCLSYSVENSPVRHPLGIFVSLPSSSAPEVSPGVGVGGVLHRLQRCVSREFDREELRSTEYFPRLMLKVSWACQVLREPWNAKGPGLLTCLGLGNKKPCPHWATPRADWKESCVLEGEGDSDLLRDFTALVPLGETCPGKRGAGGASAREIGLQRLRRVRSQDCQTACYPSQGQSQALLTATLNPLIYELFAGSGEGGPEMSHGVVLRIRR